MTVRQLGVAAGPENSDIPRRGAAPMTIRSHGQKTGRYPCDNSGKDCLVTLTSPAIIVATDKIGSVEQHGIEPIPISERQGGAFELFKLWMGANVNYVVIVTGTLPGAGTSLRGI